MAVNDSGKITHEILEDLAGMKSDDIRALPQKIIWGDPKKDASEFANKYPDPIELRNMIWGEDYSRRFDKAMEVIRGERAAKKLPDGPFTPRHSGLYPWEDGSIYCKCRLNNSLFANKRHIREHILVDFDILCNHYTYLYVNNGIKCKIVIDLDDLMRINNEHGTEEMWALIVDRLAELYDKAMAERMFNMKYEDYRRIHDRIVRVAGSFEIECGSIDEVPMAKIEVPVEKLGELFRVTPTPNLKAGSHMPKVEDVRFFKDRVTLVKFTDGSQTRSVCDGDDLFQPDVGIAYCLFKRYLGGEKVGHARFNDLMRQARQAIEDKKTAEEQAKKAIDTEKARKARKLERSKKRKARKRQEKVNLIADAIRESHTVPVDERQITAKIFEKEG